MFNTKEAVEERRTEIMRLYKEGHTQYEISKLLGFSYRQIQEDFKQLKKSFRTIQIQNYNERLAETIARIDLLEAELYESFDKSKDERTVMSVRKFVIPGKGARKPVEATQTTVRTSKRPEGDGRFLAQIAHLIQMRINLFGLMENEVRLPALPIPPPAEDAQATQITNITNNFSMGLSTEESEAIRKLSAILNPKRTVIDINVE